MKLDAWFNDRYKNKVKLPIVEGQLITEDVFIIIESSETEAVELYTYYTKTSRHSVTLKLQNGSILTTLVKNGISVNIVSANNSEAPAFNPIQQSHSKI